MNWFRRQLDIAHERTLRLPNWARREAGLPTMSEWTKMRIKPQEVEVRRVTCEETIEAHDGPRIVRPGFYVVKTPDGRLWTCSQAALDDCYEVAIP